MRFDVAAFTNLSQDHLDFHGDMETYFGAKAVAVHAGACRPRRPSASTTTTAGGCGRRASVPGLTYGLSTDADVRAHRPRGRRRPASRSGWTARPFTSALRGAFNVRNCLCAVAVARLIGIDDGVAAAGIARAHRACRAALEPVEEGQDFLVVVDYAHTPDSIQTVLAAARDVASGRVIVVFGCGGDRDRAKRPLMGARRHRPRADLTVLTSDNPARRTRSRSSPRSSRARREGGGSVRDRARPPCGDPCRDPRGASAGDVVVIAGKGHEQGQDVRRPDRAVRRPDGGRRGARATAGSGR